MKNSPSINASLSFLARDPLYETTNPYILDYASRNLPPTNQITATENVPLHDLRGAEDTLTFARSGFAHDRIVECYFQEVGHALLDYLKASSLRIFDYSVRRRDPAFPDPSKRFSGRTQPAQNAHIDTSEDSLVEFIKELHGDSAQEILSGRYMCLNVWKPLRGPLYDWPLALCDASSVDPKTDLVINDNVVSQINKLIENVLVHYNPNQKWYYLSNQVPSELLVFRQHDSEGKTGLCSLYNRVIRPSDCPKAVPHVSFPNPMSPADTVLYRESIEVRALVYF
ncbi:MAG: hypothetical protein M1816_002402 [Peltula sp. TS41687]|nr:MAG: hypothetical protein M1816_002402 [Peltula sp. TS41687]